ncbi:uncharacterized protein LOC123898289 [Trifolium pratense]|uniref:uncharacterized protein LOC123898289 n=1 Tax=Trifolium pratense TaxID=57577 RepID=UPI001E694CC0|nr:uncharacterized protein LOC123898289 [Trifolium pratense]
MNDECDKELKQTQLLWPPISSLKENTKVHPSYPIQLSINHKIFILFNISPQPHCNHVIFQVTTDLGGGGGGSVIINMFLPPWLYQILACMGGCLGCFSKPLVIISMGEADASKGQKTQAQTMNTDNRSEDFWSSSAIELDHGAPQSQRSISSIAVSNHPSDPQSSDGIQTDPPEFVNHGLLLWNQMRQHWVGNKRSERQTQVGEPKISWNATYETLLGTNKPFPRRIPLGEMVEFLVDIWELEGMYD